MQNLWELGVEYVSVDSIKRAAQRSGSHWFDPGAMRFFNSRLTEWGYRKAGTNVTYFVTSERYNSSTPRGDTVRKAVFGNGDDFDIDTVGEFRGYKSAAAAKAAILKIVTGKAEPA